MLTWAKWSTQKWQNKTQIVRKRQGQQQQQQHSKSLQQALNTSLGRHPGGFQCQRHLCWLPSIWNGSHSKPHAEWLSFSPISNTAFAPKISGFNWYPLKWVDPPLSIFILASTHVIISFKMCRNEQCPSANAEMEGGWNLYVICKVYHKVEICQWISSFPRKLTRSWILWSCSALVWSIKKCCAIYTHTVCLLTRCLVKRITRQAGTAMSSGNLYRMSFEFKASCAEMLISWVDCRVVWPWTKCHEAPFTVSNRPALLRDKAGFSLSDRGLWEWPASPRKKLIKEDCSFDLVPGHYLKSVIIDESGNVAWLLNQELCLSP